MWVAFTTSSTSLYAFGASSATPLSDLLLIMIPLWASWFTTSFPCHLFVAARLLIVRPAPWHADAKARRDDAFVPTSMCDAVPIVPPMSTGWPT